MRVWRPLHLIHLILRSALIAQLLLPLPRASADPVDTSTQPKDRGVSSTSVVGSVVPADPFTGAAHYDVPFEVPPGTGGLAPSIGLAYSSSGPLDSWVGSRWSLSLPRVSRSLKDGTPTYDDAVDTFELDGQELVPLGNGRFATRRESFLRITHLVTAQGDDSWTAERPDGTKLGFGTNENGRVRNGAAQGAKIFEWLVTEHEDLRGNAMTYSYDRTDPGQAYPYEIRYGMRRIPGGLISGIFVRVVRFVLEAPARADTSVSYRAGFQRLMSKRLDYVDVLAHTSLLRRYDLHYMESPDSFRSLLSGVDEFGSDATSGAPTPPLQTRFAYTSNYGAGGLPIPGATGWSAPVSWTWPASKTFVTSTQQDNATRLGDVDGDGLPDLVKSHMQNVNLTTGTGTLTGDSGVYFNTGSGFGNEDPSWVIPPEPTGLPLHRLIFTADVGGVQRGWSRMLIDLTGDGRVDAPIGLDGLDLSGAFGRLAYIPWFENDGTGWVARGIAPDTIWAEGHPTTAPRFHSFARLATGLGPTDLTLGGNARFAELNGDGLPDLVVQGSEVAIWATGICNGARGFSYVAINRGDFDFEQPSLVASSVPLLAGGGSPFSTVCSGTLYRTPGFFEACDPSHATTGEACQRETFFNTTYNFGFTLPPIEFQSWQHLELGNLYADVNGDGLDDLITNYEDRNTPVVGASPVLRRTVRVNLGTGAFAVNSDWALPPEALLTFVDRQYNQGGPSVNPDLGTRLIDANGDGRIDVLKARSGDASRRLWLNDGAVAQGTGDPTPWREILSGWTLPLDVVDANGRDLGVRFADIDGDAMTDILQGYGNTRTVRLNLGAVPDLLETVTVPRGATIGFGYTPSTQFDANAVGDPQYLPQVTQVVTSITVTPGHAQSPAGTTTLDYEGGLFDADEREFRGFRKVTETRPDGRITTTLYHQDIARAGQAESVEVTSVISGQTKKWARKEFLYTPDTVAPFISLLCKLRSLEYDQQTTARVSATVYEYDGQSTASTPDGSACSSSTAAVGNLTAIIEYGEVNGSSDVVPGDTRRREFAYWLPADPGTATPYLVDRVGIARLRSGASSSGALVRESNFYYDGQEGSGALPAPLSGSPPTVGNLTARRDLAFDPAAVDPVTRFEHDVYGNVTIVKRPRWNAGELGGWTTLDYDGLFHTFLTAATNEQGHRTEFGWGTPEGCAVLHPLGSGLLSQVRDPNALAAGDAGEIRCYDAFGRLTLLQAPGGLAKTSWTYVDTPGSASVTEAQWASGSAATEVARTGTVSLDGMGRAVQILADGPGAAQVRTSISYDAVGRRSQQTGPEFTAATTSQVTEWRYDALDRVTRLCLPGTTTTNCTNDTGRIQNASYNRGLVTYEDPNGNATLTTFDPLGRVVRVQEGSTTGTPVTTYEYNAADQLEAVRDSATTSNVTAIHYDGLGRRIMLDDPDAGVSTYQYDPNGNLHFATIPSANPQAPTVVEWTYASLDRPIRRTINGGSVATWTYDFGTNGLGLLRRHDAGDFRHVTKQYDLLGRPTFEQVTAPQSAPAHSFYTSYDPLGQVADRTYPTGDTVRIVHDAKGYPTAVQTPAGDPYASGIQWDALGRLAEWTAGNNFKVIRSYDVATARLGSLAVRNPIGANVQSLTYAYDNGDRLTSINDTLGSALDMSPFVYDGRDRLTSAHGPFGTNRAQVTLRNTYDALGNLTCREGTATSGCPGGTAMQYPTGGSVRPHAPIAIGGQPAAYDDAGNLLSFQLGGVTHAYAYTGLGELATTTIGGSLKASFAYEGSGRLVHFTDYELSRTLQLLAPDFEWDQTAGIGRIRIGLAGATIAVQSKTYDPQQPPGGCASLVPSLPGEGGSVLELFFPGLAALVLLSLERAYRRRRGEIWRPVVALTIVTVFGTVTLVPYPFGGLGSGTARAQAAAPPGVIYYHGDHLGSAVVITDSSGASVQQALYRPFGSAVPATGSGIADAPEFGFTSQRYVTGAELYHFGARAYQPALGRFLQPDPLVAQPFNPQNLNRYSYVLNDPLNRIDPTGMVPIPTGEDGPGYRRTVPYGPAAEDPYRRTGPTAGDQVLTDKLLRSGSTTRSAAGSSGPIHLEGLLGALNKNRSQGNVGVLHEDIGTMPFPPRTGEASSTRPFEVEIPRAVGRVGVVVKPTDDGPVIGGIEFSEILPEGPVTESRPFLIPLALPGAAPRGFDPIFEGMAATERAVRVGVRVSVGGPVRVTVSGEQTRIKIRSFEFDPRSVATR